METPRPGFAERRPSPASTPTRSSARSGARPVFRLPGPEPKRPLEGVVMLELATWLGGSLRGSSAGRSRRSGHQDRAAERRPLWRMITNENMIRATQGKETIAVDLKTEGGQQILRRLVTKADVVMHNFRPGVPALSVLTTKPSPRSSQTSYISMRPRTGQPARTPGVRLQSHHRCLLGNSVFQSGDGNIPIGDQSPDPSLVAGSRPGSCWDWRPGGGPGSGSTWKRP